METSGPGGAERVLIHLCRTLRERGHRVHTLLLRSGWLESQLVAQGVDVTILPLAKPLDRRFLGVLRGLLSELEPDVFHSHEFTYGLYGRLSTLGLGIPHVATVHGTNFTKGGKRRVIGSVLFRGSKRFRLVAVSESLSLTVSKRFMLNSKAVNVVPNGVEMDLDVATPLPRREGPLKLVAVGNLYPVKNHALLIHAVNALEAKGLNVTLDILGRGKEEPDLRSLVDRYQLSQRVALRGFREDVTPFLSASHILVSSSLSEGMPLSFLEAMLKGLPVIASSVGGVPEIVEHEHHGLLYESGDLGGLVSAIARLAADDKLRCRLGDAAAVRVRTHFSVDRMAERYEELYRELALGSPA